MAGPFGSLSPFDPSTFDPSTYAGLQPMNGANGPSFSDYATVITPAAQQGWLNSPRPEAPPNDSGGGTALTPSSPGYASTETAGSGPQSAVPDSSLIGRLRSLLSGNPGQAFQGVGDAAGNWIANNRNTLMALGAGMAGAQNLGQGLSRGMGAAIPAMQTDQRQQIMNQTALALMKRGLPQDVALAAATNPAIMQQLIPSLFGGRKLLNVNGVLIDEATGQKVADYSEATKWQLGKVSDPNTGIETSVLYQPGTGQTKSIAPGALPQATGAGGPATGNMSIPPEVRTKSSAEQFRDAPDGSTGTLGGRPVIKRNGRWEYQ